MDTSRQKNTSLVLLILSKKTLDFMMKIYDNCKEVMEDMDNPISLHVRRTDYVEKSQDHPPCSMNYYKQH